MDDGGDAVKDVFTWQDASDPLVVKVCECHQQMLRSPIKAQVTQASGDRFVGATEAREGSEARPSSHCRQRCITLSFNIKLIE